MVSTRSRSCCQVLSLLLGAALLFGSPEARGQSPAPASAEELDAEGTALLNQRRLEEACPKLAESFRRKPGTGVGLRLALCQELSGKISSAHASYLDAARRAEAADDPRVVELARRRARELEPRLSHLTISLDASVRDVASLEVWRNGVRLERAKLETPLPLDPGMHRFEATAPGRARFEETVVVSEKPTEHSLVIALPPVATARAASLGAIPAREPPAVWSAQKSFSVASAGVGLAGVTVGTILGLRVSSKRDRARELCANGTNGCPEEALNLEDEARSNRLVSNFAFGFGAVGLVAGLALWFTDRPAPERVDDAGLEIAPGVRVEPSVGTGAGGLRATGRW